MGEWSKSVGEKGEKLLKFLFEDILNYNSLIENKTIGCFKGQKHIEGKSERTTHGLDGVVSYVSPLEDATIDIAIISSKYESKEYIKYPSTQFKSHIKNLAQTIECFHNSKLKNNINKNFSSDIRKTEVIGVLLWLSNESNLDFELTSKVANIQIDDDYLVDKIILVDNHRINFLFESIYSTIQKYGIDKVNFVYHDTGINSIKYQENTFGKVFPLNYLYSDVILLRVENSDEIEFHIYVNDDFNEMQFVQMLNFAQSFDNLNAAKKVVLFYKNYDYLNFEGLVKEKLSQFNNYRLEKNLQLRKFPADFRNK